MSHVFWGIVIALFGGLTLVDGSWYGDHQAQGVGYIRPLIAVAIVIVGTLGAIGFFGTW